MDYLIQFILINPTTNYYVTNVDSYKVGYNRWRINL